MTRTTATTDTREPDEDEYLDTAAVAAIVGMSRDYVRRQCKAGNLPAKKLGRDYRISRAALRRFMASTDPVPTDRPMRHKTARQRRRDST